MSSSRTNPATHKRWSQPPHTPQRLADTHSQVTICLHKRTPHKQFSTETWSSPVPTHSIAPTLCTHHRATHAAALRPLRLIFYLLLPATRKNMWIRVVSKCGPVASGSVTSRSVTENGSALRAGPQGFLPPGTVGSLPCWWRRGGAPRVWGKQGAEASGFPVWCVETTTVTPLVRCRPDLRAVGVRANPPAPTPDPAARQTCAYGRTESHRAGAPT